MDNRANTHELFSRGSTPPSSVQYTPQQQQTSNNSTSNLVIDSLFQGMSAPPPDQQQQQQHSQQQSSSNVDPHSGDNYDTASIASGRPVSNEPLDNVSTASGPTVTDRQNALLSLLSPSLPSASRPPLPQPPQQLQPQTPPGTSQRANASPQADSQKILLEQLMGGGSTRSNTYPDSQRSNNVQPAPSPPFSQREEYGGYGLHSQSNETSPRSQPIPHSHLAQQPQLPPQQQTQQQPPSPRRSMFEFVSPFDHLSTTGSIKKKPPPSNLSSGTEDSSWTTVPDPKRQSVENLLENLTRGHPQQHISMQPQAPAYESYLSGEYVQADSSPARAPLPPIPSTRAVPNRTNSPRGSPPKAQTIHRPQPRAGDINVSQQQVQHQSTQSIPPALNHRDNEGSPGPRSTAKAKTVQSQPKYSIKSQPSPIPQSQSIIFDVSQPLEEIQAPRDYVKSTAIALVKQDAIFLPGTTIGATHWVAYAMTRGRVRVISRSSGDRTLLQLPSVFPQASSVTDMAVYGNRLAGVTSDGGFVIWELPEVITDDVPGRVLLCVPPSNTQDALRAVKWHPKDPDTLAVASDNKIYVLDLINTRALHGQPLPHANLHHLGQLFSVPSPIVAFDFDVIHYTLATISEDSSLTIWNMQDRAPIAVHKVRGEDIPSSLTFVDGGLVVGRKNGTIFQLLSMTTKSVLSTVKFVNGNQEDTEMFGHISYDTRIQTLWVANSRRDSLVALRIHLEPTLSGGEESVRGYVDQVAEFSGLKPTIHFVILTADADPHGDEAHAACIAAKINPGELALVAFSVHSSGVDQVLIRKEWYEHALASTESKYPVFDLPIPLPLPEIKPQRAPLPIVPAVPQPQPQMPSFVAPLTRARTPPSDDVAAEYDDGTKKSSKGKNVNWKENQETAKEKDKAPKNINTTGNNDAAIINDSTLGQALSREIKKTEESLHTRIGRLINKELDKQHQRFEEARLHDQAEDFARQEKILKLISTELTRNTTRVVELAVKSEIQNSVLPSLESITRNEVKSALNDQIGVGLIDAINRSLPAEMEKLLLRPNISNHFAGILSTALTPMIERHIKEVMTTSFFQFHSQQTAAMHQDLLRELRSEISNIKAELGSWHNESLRGQEATIRDLEHTVRSLSEQVKFLSLNNQPSAIHHQPPPQAAQSSPGAPPPSLQGNHNQSHLRQANLPPQPQPIPQPSYGPAPLSSYQQSHPAPPPAPAPQPAVHPQWYGIAAPQASHPATILQAPVAQSQAERTPPVKPDEWDNIYLSVLHAQDSTKLQDLLSRTNPDLVLPLNGPPLVSQAVILTLIHRLSAVVSEISPTDESFKNSLWWLQRVASLLRPEDKLIADFIPRVIPTVQQSINTTKARMAILPGSATMESARALTDVQETLRRKVST